MIAKQIYDELAKERDEIKRKLDNPRWLDRNALNYLRNRLAKVRALLKDAHREHYKELQRSGAL